MNADHYPVWVVTADAVDSPWGIVAAVLPIERRSLADKIAKLIDGRVHPGSASPVSLNQGVIVGPEGPQ